MNKKCRRCGKEVVVNASSVDVLEGMQTLMSLVPIRAVSGGELLES